jgi:hypothetical protein
MTLIWLMIVEGYMYVYNDIAKRRGGVVNSNTKERCVIEVFRRGCNVV